MLYKPRLRRISRTWFLNNYYGILSACTQCMMIFFSIYTSHSILACPYICKRKYFLTCINEKLLNRYRWNTLEKVYRCFTHLTIPIYIVLILEMMSEVCVLLSKAHNSFPTVFSIFFYYCGTQISSHLNKFTLCVNDIRTLEVWQKNKSITNKYHWSAIKIIDCQL